MSSIIYARHVSQRDTVQTADHRVITVASRTWDRAANTVTLTGTDVLGDPTTVTLWGDARVTVLR